MALTDYRETASANGARPVGELVKHASEQISTLVRDEIRLAKLELAAKGKRAGRGAGMFGGAGLDGSVWGGCPARGRGAGARAGRESVAGRAHHRGCVAGDSRTAGASGEEPG